MAASCNFLLLPFSANPNFSLPSNVSLRSSPTFRTPISAKLEKSFTTIAAENSSNPFDFSADPSLQYANVLFFRSGYNVQIVVDEGEPEEVLLRRFRREVSKAGVIQECKRRRFFENKQEEKKRKAREAGRRNRRRRSGPRSTPTTEGNIGPKKTAEDDDNWDMPEGHLPF